MQSNEKTVLVTRPAHQSDHLCGLLTAAGFTPIRYPTIAIQAVENTAHISNTLYQHSNYDYLIFISANAVIQADRLIDHQWQKTPSGMIAIGPKTADTLDQLGLKPTITAAKPFNSERLLTQLPSDLKQKKGLIIKGKGGRTLLAEQLQKRGMTVDTLDVYQRTLPNNYKTSHNKKPAYITITSQLALDNLFLIPPRPIGELKQQCTFVVFSERLARYASSLDCQHLLISHGASDKGLVSAINQDKKR